METDDLEATLQDAGLSPYQAKAYVVLLERGSAKATAIADASGVPAPRIYDVLESLESEGYVETFEQDTLKARAHSAADVLDDLRGRADRFEQAAEEVEDRWERPELASNEASIVKRYKTVRQQAREYVETAEFQVQLCGTYHDFQQLKPVLADAYDRGVSVRLTITGDVDDEPPDPEEFEGVCIEARYRRIPAPFLTVVDRERSCFANNRDSFDPYGVLVNDRTHTYVFHWYFLTSLWEHWETLYTTQAEELPIDYLEIRRLVRDLEPLLAVEATVRVRVEGRYLQTGEECTLTGTVEDVVWAGDPGQDTGGNRQLSGQVSVVLATADDVVTVGGWAATLEEVEATRFTVLEVHHPDADPEYLLDGRREARRKQ